MRDFLMNGKKAKRREQLAEMSEDELLLRHQKCMRDLELIWDLAEELMENRSQSDSDQFAILSAKAGSFKHQVYSFHREADIWAAQAGVSGVSTRSQR